MTEPIMYFGMGFLVATLLSLLVVMRVHHRALRVGSTGQFHADVAQLEEQLTVALGERGKLQHEIASVKRGAETIWAVERVEGALLRERINDVANEVVRIARSLETPGSSIEPVSANAALVIERGRRTQTLNINSASGEASARTINKGAPADRLLALRTMVASRAAAN
jgi:hypothetical protein